jgi:hypothetical protein
LNGALVVQNIGGFTPSIGDQFAIMTYGSRTGRFSSVTLPSVAGLAFDTVWTTGRSPDTLYVVVNDAGALNFADGPWTGSAVARQITRSSTRDRAIAISRVAAAYRSEGPRFLSAMNAPASAGSPPTRRAPASRSHRTPPRASPSPRWSPDETQPSPGH